MPLVEVVPHKGTSDSTIQGALAFYKSVGRKPVHIRQEVPGFAANRLQAALCNEAYSLVSRGVLSAEDLGEPIIPRSHSLLHRNTNLVFRCLRDLQPWSPVGSRRTTSCECHGRRRWQRWVQTSA